MSYVLGALLELKDKGFTSGVKESISATGQLKDELEKTSKSSDGFGKKIKNAGKVAAIGIAAVGTAAVAMGSAAFAATLKVTDGFDHIAKTSRKMGVSSDFYQEMDYWAGQNGVSQANMEKSMQRLNQRVGEARAGNEKYTGALKTLGIDMNAVRDGTLSTEDAMAQSISALSKMTNEQDKAALASELFGTKLSQELMPAIQEGSLSMEDAQKKAKELGFVIGEDTLSAAEEFNDTWDDLTRSVGAFSKKGIAMLMPFFQKLMDWALVGIPIVQTVVSKGFTVIGNVMSWLGEKGRLVFDTIKERILANQPTISNMRDLFTQIKDKVSDLYEASKPVFTWLGEEGIPIVADAMADIVEGAMSIYNVISNNWSTIEPFVIGITAAFVGWKAVTMAQSTVTGVMTAAQWALNAAMTANPIGLIVVGIGALIGVGILLYRNWDIVKEKAGQLWQILQDNPILAIVAGPFGALISAGIAIYSNFDKIKAAFDRFKSAISNFKLPEWVTSIGSKIGGAASKVGGWISGSHETGLRRVPYDGYVAELHKGEAVLPKSEAERYRKGNLVNNHTANQTTNNSGGTSKSENVIYINVDAKDKSPEEFANEFVPILKERLANM